MKNWKILTILFISIILLTGCGKKQSITAEEFYNRVKDKDITLYDVTSSYGYGKKVFQTQDENYKIVFVEGKDLSTIQGIFFDEVANIYRDAGISDKTAEAKAGELTTKAVEKRVDGGKDYENVEVKSNSKYYYISYIDNTYLYIVGSLDYMDLYNEIKDSTGY